MEFKNKIKKRIYLMAIYAIIGAVLCVLSYTGKLTNDLVKSFGAAIIVVGIVKIIQNARVLKNPEKLQKCEIAEKDERNIMIWEKACSLAFNVYIILAGTTVIGLYIFNMETAGQIVADTVCGFVAIYFICYCIVRKKY